MKKILILSILGILVLGGLWVGAAPSNNYYEKIKTESMKISEPIIKYEGQYITVDLKEKKSFLLEPEKPMLPVISQVFTFPFKTKINSVEVIFSETNKLILQKEVKPALEPTPVGLKVNSEPVKDLSIYENTDLYPSIDYSYTIASGLYDDNHVVYLTLQLYPIKYSPLNNMIYFSENADIKIIYDEPASPMIFDEVYDMVIIAPQEYSNALQPLINHKNSYGIKTILKTTEDIYSNYQGIDEAEQIKYFIRDSIENWGIDYVLLIGSIDKLPIRSSYANPWEGDLLTDIYYADIYNATGDFCTWDENNNGKFGEVHQDHHNTYDIDGVDLYPDVNIGRLACVDTKEVSTVVDKIIYYEKNTYSSSWFNNIILAGGDTFPGHNGNDGEEINLIVEQIMSDFASTKLWTSTNTFNANKLNQAINIGAGFVDYSGHGVEVGILTHPPNSNRWIKYYNINLLGLSNGYKIPIIFFDACLTSKLDYKGTNSYSYNLKPVLKIKDLSLINQIIKHSSIIQLLLSNNYNLKSTLIKNMQSYDKISETPVITLVPCFSWNFISKSDGGAIADIGATRTAFGGIDSGAGKISIEFFSAYKNNMALGQMMTQAQNGYITDVPNDLLTVEEFILLGDPSLNIGGYPQCFSTNN
jgi:hypothetical protein